MSIGKDCLAACSDEDFRKLGIFARGDIIALRTFGQGKSTSYVANGEERIQKFKHYLQNNDWLGGGEPEAKKEPKGRFKGEKTVLKKKDLNFRLGWKHYKDREKGFVQMKANQGGGVRKKALPRDASIAECKKIIVEIFFPSGTNGSITLDNVDFYVGNVHDEKVESIKIEGVEVDFSPALYKSHYGFKEPSLYLMTKEVLSNTSDEVSDIEDTHLSDDEFEDISRICMRPPNELAIPKEPKAGPSRAPMDADRPHEINPCK
eukprot:Seg5064.3 transcript_id=Seg5064.3/GoldUCD/mRNA.D3Y31 product="hypothetical protein" protein_id=Seg5064.3/GoldUCD/D3Y31